MYQSMIFNSLPFFLFFALFFIVYWGVFKKSVKHQNLFLLLGSFTFYIWADWRFLTYLIAATIFNFYIAHYIEKTSNFKKRQLLKTLGIVQNIGGLAFFKYFNFFISSFNDAFHSLGLSINLQTLNIIIPLASVISHLNQ